MKTTLSCLVIMMVLFGCKKENPVTPDPVPTESGINISVSARFHNELAATVYSGDTMIADLYYNQQLIRSAYVINGQSYEFRDLQAGEYEVRHHDPQNEYAWGAVSVSAPGSITIHPVKYPSYQVASCQPFITTNNSFYFAGYLQNYNPAVSYHQCLIFIGQTPDVSNTRCSSVYILETSNGSNNFYLSQEVSANTAHFQNYFQSGDSIYAAIYPGSDGTDNFCTIPCDLGGYNKKYNCVGEPVRVAFVWP